MEPSTARWSRGADVGATSGASARDTSHVERSVAMDSRRNHGESCREMLTRISGLTDRHQLRADIVKQINGLVARRGAAPRAVRVAFFDDDGPRGGVAIRCALMLTPSRGPILRVEHTARTYSAAFKGALTVLTRQLKRRAQRRRRRLRYSRPRPDRIGDRDGIESEAPRGAIGRAR